MQTDEIDKMDNRSEYDHPNTPPTGVRTDFPNGVNKCAALDPVIGRHAQTEVVKSAH